jgi:hypothetical protein
MHFSNLLSIAMGVTLAACSGGDFSALFTQYEGGAPPVGVDAAAADARDVAPAEASAPDVPTSCIPSQEICNGLDDDCNGAIDEPCPASLAWDMAVKRSALGQSPGGAEFSETCDGDEALVGLRVAAGAWVDQIRAVCRKVTLAWDNGKTPYEYTLELTASRELAPYPASTTSPIRDLLCSSNKILVGLRISQQWYMPPTGEKTAVIPSIWATCAEPVLKLGATPPRVEWKSSAEIGPVAGAFVDPTASFAHDVVESGTVLVGLHGGSGAWVDRIGLSSATLGVVFR